MRAIEAPLRQIADNAGQEGSVVVEKVKAQSFPIGYNALTGAYEDLIQAGIVDPAKVVRSGLQDAASIAGLVLTTEALVAEIPEPAAPLATLAWVVWAVWAAWVAWAAWAAWA